MDPLVTGPSASRARLDDWVEEFRYIYCGQEARRSAAESWTQVVQHAGVVAEAIRLECYGECLEQLARCFCWICSFHSRWRRRPKDANAQVSRPLSQVVLEKYPCLCPSCGEPQCRCPVNRYELSARPPNQEAVVAKVSGKLPGIYEGKTPATLEEFIEMFRVIYGQVHEGLPVEAVALHFIEEVGEVANAIRLLGGGGTGKGRSSIKQLEWEVADVFSWVCNLFLRARQHFGILDWYSRSLTRQGPALERAQQQITFSAVIWGVYAGDSGRLRCPSCGGRPCSELIPEPDAKAGTNWHVEGGSATGIVITIDGPSGAGKSTVAQKVAACLGLTYVDSGATYRAAALKVLQSGISPDDEQAVAGLIAQTDIRVTTDGLQPRVLMDGEDVTEKIRTPEVTLAAPKVSRLPAVRAKLVAVQRGFAIGRGVVMEGRDIGTVVFPNAALKVFLKADPEERARRRLKQDRKEGRSATLEQTAYEIGRRDQLDAERKISPLVAAADAYQIDSTDLLADQVVEQILELARKKKLLERET